MALTAAERAKRYREKLKQNHDVGRLKQNRKKHSDLTEEDKECRRKQWREERKK